MTNYKEILRLNSLGINNTQIAASCRCSRTTVIAVLQRAQECGVNWQKAAEMSDRELSKMLFPTDDVKPTYKMPDYDYVHREMAKSGVTLMLLWLEYCDQCRESGDIPYKSTQFNKYYGDYIKTTKATMHIGRKPGELLEVDWAGQTAEITDTDTGEAIPAYIFVASLPYSGYSYVEAFLSQNMESWIGYRDTAQDILAMVPFDAERAKDKIRLLLGQQYKDGHVNHYLFPNEGWEPVTSVHSDDHLWIIMSVYDLVIETGRLDFLRETAEFYDGGEDTVYNHLKKSIDFTMNNTGKNGFPLMLRSDWNDMLYKVCREGKGESIWTSMQLGTVLLKMAELATLMGENGAEYLRIYEEQKKLVNSVAWDGEWYRRCITDDGMFIGSNQQPQAKIWLNTQSWAVISGMGNNGEAAMDSVKKHLDTDLGIKKIHPSMSDYPSKEDPLTYYNKGCGENGSVFCHANTWAIIAECMLGRAENAYKYYHQLLPMVAQKKATQWRYKAEPYVYASNIFGPESDKFGLANVSWLTGTAAWMYIAVTQHMLGIKARWNGLEINPCLSNEMLPAKVIRIFRGCRYHIHITKNEKVFIPHVEGRKEFEALI